MKFYGTVKESNEDTQCSPTELKGMVASLFLYFCAITIVTSLLTIEEEFHTTRDVDSSSWYLKTDHDVIMTLSENSRPTSHCSFPLCALAGIKMKSSPSISSPSQSNSMSLLTTSLLMHTRISAQLASLLNSIHCPPAESFFTGYLASNIKRTLRTEYSGSTSRNVTSGQPTFMISSAVLLLISVYSLKLSVPLWSDSAMAGYQSASGKAMRHYECYLPAMHPTRRPQPNCISASPLQSLSFRSTLLKDDPLTSAASLYRTSRIRF
jgi:hypothetical protein